MSIASGIDGGASGCYCSREGRSWFGGTSFGTGQSSFTPYNDDL
jgi:hypothetical protein